jgi:hypothetical protein
MSRNSGELVKRFTDAFNRRDVQIFAGIATPDFEWTMSVMTVEVRSSGAARVSTRTSSA